MRIDCRNEAIEVMPGLERVVDESALDGRRRVPRRAVLQIDVQETDPPKAAMRGLRALAVLGTGL